MNVPVDIDEAEDPIAISITCSSWERSLSDAIAETRRAVKATFHFTGMAELAAEVSFLLADDDALRALNLNWREQDKPTNVLSFPAVQLDAGKIPVAEFEGQALALGDVALAYQTVALEAGAAGIPFSDHFDHLVVHGVLHLLGYDHQSDVEAEVMEDLERLVLASLDIPDPYSLSEISTPAIAKERRS